MPRCLKLSLALLLAAVSAPATAHGALLDPGFGTNGRTTTVFNTESAVGEDVAQAPDGKLVVAGYVSENRFAVARYLPSGAPDPSFSEDGRATVSFPDFNAVGMAVVVQPDRRIVVAGTARPTGEEGSKIALARLTTLGSLDTTFSGDGRVVTTLGDFSDASDVLLQPDGKLVVAGQTFVQEAAGQDEVFAVARYTSGGSPDDTFGGGDGVATADFPGSEAAGRAVALASAGRIVVAGNAIDGMSRFAVARFTAGGSPDPGFGDGGTAVYDVGSGASDARGLAVQPDGKLVVGGSARSGATRRVFGLLRVDGTGEPDPAFSGDGQAVVAFGTSDDAFGYDLIAAPGNAVLMAGAVRPGGQEGPDDFAVARVRADGSPDPAFDGDGRLTTSFGGPSSAAALLRQADGKLVVAGTTADPETFAGRFALARYDESGAEVRASVLELRGGSFNDQMTVAPAAGGGLAVRDAARPLAIGPGCTRVSPNEATCTGAVSIRADLGEGNDSLTVDPAVTTRATLAGGPGNDALRGGSGPDTLDGGTGADDLIGGGDRDTVTYATRTSAVVLDVNGLPDDGSATDASGSRRDAIGADVETLVGGFGADTLRGDGSSETFDGGPGADTFTGRGGTDAVTYAGRLAGVTVDIGAGGADDGSALDQTGALRDDVQTGIEALVGGRDADTLIGDAAANRFTSRGDGLRDVVLCGAATDSVSADALDLFAAGDCETVSRG